MHLAWPEAEAVARRTAAAVQRVASRELARLLREASSSGIALCGAGVVGSADRDLAKIGNYHIRAHAAEGILFRRALSAAAEAGGLRCRADSEKELYERAQTRLRRPEVELRRVVSELGRGVARPWRADEKTAALAAWLAMATYGGSR